MVYVVASITVIGVAIRSLVAHPRNGRADTPPALLATASCEPGAQPFRVGNWPDACWRPYSSASVFNRKVPRNSPVSRNSRKVVRRMLKWGPPAHYSAGVANSLHDWGKPTYYPEPADPLYRLVCTGAGPPTSGGGFCEPGLDGMTVGLPVGARPAGWGMQGERPMDFHMTVVEQQRGLEFDLWNVQSIASGEIVFGGGGVTAIGGGGLGSGAVASGWGNLAGLIRAQELQRGRIDHKLMASTNCVSGTVRPARGSTIRCVEKGMSDRYAPKLGQLLRLDYTDAEIEALRLPAWKKAIARAAAEYGILIGDHGSNGRSFALAFESGNTYESFGFEDGMVTFARDAGIPAAYDREIGRTTYAMDIASGIDWSRLRVIRSCVATRKCR